MTTKIHSTYSSKKLLTSLQELKKDIEINGPTELATTKKAVLDQILAATKTLIQYEPPKESRPNINFVERPGWTTPEEIHTFHTAVKLSEDIDEIISAPINTKR